ncbi:MAG: hypothetical protein V3V77_04090 [Candidatus Bipolaricaulota bacterium]
MRSYSMLFFSIGMAMIAGAQFHRASPIFGAAGLFLGALWIILVITDSTTRALTLLFFASIMLALIVTLSGETPYLTVCALSSVIIGWEFAVTGREIAAFPRKAQRGFLRPYLLRTLALGIGGSLLAVLALRGHYYLSFRLALALGFGALLLLGVMFKLGPQNND